MQKNFAQIRVHKRRPIFYAYFVHILRCSKQVFQTEI